MGDAAVFYYFTTGFPYNMDGMYYTNLKEEYALQKVNIRDTPSLPPWKARKFCFRFWLMFFLFLFWFAPEAAIHYLW